MSNMFELARKNPAIVDNWYRLFELQFEVIKETEIDYILNALKPYNINKFVDVGCGAGDITVDLMEKSSYEMEGIEPEKLFFNKTIEKYSDKNINFQNIPLEDYSSSADCLLFRFVMQHFKDLTTLCKKSQDVLNKNGLVVVVESYFFDSSPEMIQYKNTGKTLKKAFSRGSSQSLEDNIIFSFENNGFELIENTIHKISPKTLESKKTFSDMLHHAAYVKTAVCDQDLNIIEKVDKELELLHTEEAKIDYQDLILIFKKK